MLASGVKVCVVPVYVVPLALVGEPEDEVDGTAGNVEDKGDE